MPAGMWFQSLQNKRLQIMVGWIIWIATKLLWVKNSDQRHTFSASSRFSPRLLILPPLTQTVFTPPATNCRTSSTLQLHVYKTNADPLFTAACDLNYVLKNLHKIVTLITHKVFLSESQAALCLGRRPQRHILMRFLSHIKHL